jgi:MFS family permease
VILVSAVFGSIAVGPLVDNFGRRNSLLLNTIPFIIGPIIMCLSPSYWILILGRFVTGFGVGVATTTAPLYISEISPPMRRGAFVMVRTALL